VKSFKPIIDERARVLILGTAPGAESLRKMQYYADPKNQFWTIIYSLFSMSPDQENSKRIRFVKDRRIALWDVLHSCFRPGSLDSSITGEAVNNFQDLFSEYPRVRCVAFNGSKAYEFFKRHVGLSQSMQFVQLPSTSPTPGKHVKSLEAKIKEWNRLKGFLD